MIPLYHHTISELHKLLKTRNVSCTEIVNSVLERISRVEPKIKAFITLTLDDAIKRAREIDKKIAHDQDIIPLMGIPVAIKDSFLTKNVKTTAGSKVLDDYIGQYDATIVKKLKKHGAIILGKTNLDEFSFGFTTETSAFGSTSNPWDIQRTPGGSSGGSAAAVAADETIYAIGSEHYDSIRQPAAWCGVVGFKPTYGLVSRHGIIAMASSLECPGPITKTVEDASIVLDAIVGYDSHDANSLKTPITKYWRNLSPNAKNIKLGIAEEYFDKNIEKGILLKINEAINTFRNLGVELIKIKLPSIKQVSSVFEILYRTEVASNLARYDGIRYGQIKYQNGNLDSFYSQTRRKFGPLIKNAILTDLRAISDGEFDSFYRDSLKIRSSIIKEFEEIFKKVDLIVSPMSPCLPFKKGFYRDGKYYGTKETDKFRSVVDIIAQLPALCGLPGISILCGFVHNLPIGLQLYGPLFSEQKLLNTSYAYEKETEWCKIKTSLL